MSWRSDPRWGIVAASLRSPDTHDALEPQDGLYTLAVRSGAGEALRVIGSIRAGDRRAAGDRRICSRR